MASKKTQGGSIASLIRQAGQQAKQAIEKASEEARVVTDEPQLYKPNIFNVIDYIESGWGLNMKLYPVQRFIVKLYYFLPLDDKNKTIEITDMFNTKVLYRFTEVEYLHYLHAEGRCNIGEQDHERRQLILPIGRRAGKCCREGTLVLTQDGFVKIQDLGDPNGAEYQPLCVGVAQEGSTRSTSAFFYNGGERDTLRVRTRYGYEIEGTPNHRLRVMSEDGTIQWRALEDMKEGDRIGVHRGTDLWATSYVPTDEYHPDQSNNKHVNLPSDFDESWGTLLGVLVGAGTWDAPQMLEVTVGPYPEWLSQVDALLRETVGRSTIYPEPKREGVFRVRCYSKQARLFLDRIGYNLSAESHTKRIPWIVWRSPKPVVAGFLRGLFETDGSIERGRRVTFSTASERLAAEVQLLLLNFGILSKFKARWNEKYGKFYFHLELVGADSIRIFAKQIGFLSERKSSLLKAHIAKGDLGNKSATEAIPFQREWCRRLIESVPNNNGDHARGKALGWRRSLLRVALGNCIKNCKEVLSYPRLRSALAVAKNVGADSGVIEHFERILDANYFYDAVVSITPDRGRVYDLTVPDGESFVANGFTNHNTTISGIFASYEVYRLLNLHNPQAYYGLPNGNRIQIISVATDKDQAGLLFNEVSTHLARCEYFEPYVANKTLSHVQFRTPFDIERYGISNRTQGGKFVSFVGKATLRVTFKSCIAKGLRGSGNAVVILDEMAHFKDAGNSSAEEVYQAVTPSTAAFSPKDPKTGMPIFGPETETEARIICISSPLNRVGMFYKLFQQAMSGGPAAKTMLAIQAPTWEVNPTVPASYYRQKFHEDPVVFSTEHGAQFSDQVRAYIERPQDLMACVDADLRPKERGQPREPHQMGIDIALVGDGSAVVITHVEDDMIVLDYHEAWYAGEDWKVTNPHLGESYPTPYARRIGEVERLDFDEIGNWIVALTKRFYITDGIFDRWSGLPLEQGLHKKGLTQFKAEFFTRDQSSRMYQAHKLLMADRKIRIYNYPIPDVATDGRKNSPFINELTSLQAEQVSKNIVVVQKPNMPGARDDVSDAYVRSVWLSYQRMETHKIVRGAYAATGSVTAAKGVAVGAYQLSRARRHGGFSERTVAKNLGLRFRGR